jgi:hypothetical protein
MIARFYMTDRPTCFLDNACPLMTEYDWLGHGIELIARNQISVANARRHEADEDFVVARVLEGYFFDVEWRPGRARNGGACLMTNRQGNRLGSSRNTSLARG